MPVWKTYTAVIVEQRQEMARRCEASDGGGKMKARKGPQPKIARNTRIAALRAQGASWDSLASQYGISVKAIQRVCRLYSPRANSIQDLLNRWKR